MMKAFLWIVAGTMPLASCDSCTIKVGSSDAEIIEPSKTFTKAEYQVSPFTKISSNVVANIKIVQSEMRNGQIELSTPNNYIELFKFDSKEGRLVISYSKDYVNIHSSRTDITGIGNITCYASETMDGKVTGVGSLKYAGNPKQKNINKPVTGSIKEI